MIRKVLLLVTALLVGAAAPAQKKAPEQAPAPKPGVLNNTKVDGFRPIWFDLGQKSEYGSKYNGAFGTYTMKHRPLAIYSPVVDKTFFVFGGTTSA